MKRKMLTIAICLLPLLTINTINAAQSSDIQDSFPTARFGDQKFPKGDIEILVQNGAKEIWQKFGWYFVPSIFGGYQGFLLPMNQDSSFIEPQKYSDEITFLSDMTFKVTDSHNALEQFNQFRQGGKVKDFVQWLAGEEVYFRFGETGLQIEQTSNESLFRVNGDVINYSNLSLTNAPKSVYTKFAVVPNEEGVSARYIDQARMDTRDPYYIRPVTAPWKYVNFDPENFNVQTVTNKQVWRLTYDEKKFAYKITPEYSEFPDYEIVWNTPINDNVLVSPPVGGSTGTDAQFWHFRQTSSVGVYEIVSMEGSVENWRLNLDRNGTNVSVVNFRKRPSEKQKFLMVKPRLGE